MLSDVLSQVLLNVVSFARESETRTISYACDPGDQVGAFDCKVKHPVTGEDVMIGEGLQEDPIMLLEEYGYVKRTGLNSLIVLSTAFDFAAKHQLPFEPGS